MLPGGAPLFAGGVGRRASPTHTGASPRGQPVRLSEPSPPIIWRDAIRCTSGSWFAESNTFRAHRAITLSERDTNALVDRGCS